MHGPDATFTAFAGTTRIAAGPLSEVAVRVRRHNEARDETAGSVLVFSDADGRPIDLDLRGSDAEIEARYGSAAAPRGPGRPKLGVVPREVTLLPRHWDWLGQQPGGASVALRKLVEAAARRPDGTQARRTAQEAADRFMMAMAGDRPGYEDAARALYVGEGERFAALTEPWPEDVRRHVRHLAAPAFG